jgi:glyoxalase family protein
MNKMIIGGVNNQVFVASNLGRIEHFYSLLLGLPLVKRTVHHLDPRLPVITFGFQVFEGEPKRRHTISYIEWNPIFYMMPEAGFVDPRATSAGVACPRVGDPKGRWGAGTNHHLALHVPTRNGLLKWKRRLTDLGVHVTGPYNRQYFHAVYFRDPDGAIIEIATTEPGFGHDEAVLGSGFRPQPKENLIGGRDEVLTAAETWPQPVPTVAEDFALRGFHHITSISSNAERTENFFTTRAPSSGQERSQRGTQSYVAFDLNALFLDRRRQTQLAPEFTGRLVDRKLRRRRDGADVTVRIAEIEELAI